MSDRNIDWRETTFARDRTIDTLLERIRALEMELSLLRKASGKPTQKLFLEAIEGWQAATAERDALKAEVERLREAFVEKPAAISINEGLVRILIDERDFKKLARETEAEK